MSEQQQYQEALKQLRHARSDHIRWRSFANGMSSGVDIDLVHAAPIEHTQCPFGVWYHHQKTQKLLGHFASFGAMDSSHRVLHQIYEKICEKQAKKQFKEIPHLLENLNEVSKQLLETANLLEKELLEKLEK